jgi:hypothetical protein
MRDFDQPEKLIARSRRFAFSRSCHGCAAIAQAALSAPNDDARTAPQIVGRLPPILPHNGEPCQVAEGGADIGVVGAERLLDDGEGALVLMSS